MFASNTMTGNVMPEVVVIEFNYYHGRYPGEMVVKELAAYDLRTAQKQTFIFKPPYYWSDLPRRQQQRNSMRRKHGMYFGWEVGHVQYSQLSTVLTQLTRKYKIVACDGISKGNLIAAHIDRPIHNIGEKFIPNVEANEEKATWCMYHNERARHSCAYWKVQVLANYLRSMCIDVVRNWDLNKQQPEPTSTTTEDIAAQSSVPNDGIPEECNTSIPPPPPLIDVTSNAVKEEAAEELELPYELANNCRDMYELEELDEINLEQTPSPSTQQTVSWADAIE